MGKQPTKHAIDDAALCRLMLPSIGPNGETLPAIIEIVDGLTEPRLFVRGVEIKPELNEQGGRVRIFGATRYRWQIRHKGKRRKITRNRLVWLWYFGHIAEGCDIHHGELGKYFDGLANLDVLSEQDHLAFHYGANATNEIF